MNMFLTNTPFQTVVVIPTYNEINNIRELIPQIFKHAACIDGIKISVLIVDDTSPDGTAEAVKEMAKTNTNIHLITGKKEGYGKACIRGFQYALSTMEADFILQMDADFSHDPAEIPFLLHRLLVDSDVVIGSRYVPGGKIPQNWSVMRKLNSSAGNFIARYGAGMTQVNDCTGGFRAIKADILRQIDLDTLSVKGYAFQIGLLYSILQLGVTVTEVPITFRDRTQGYSKLGISDRVEFIMHVLTLRMRSIKNNFLIFLSVALVILFIFWLGQVYSLTLNYFAFLAASLGVISIILTIQSLFTIFWMLYAWEQPDHVRKNKSPKTFIPPRHGFTALLPARHEEMVIADTIRAIDRIKYPDSLKELIIICRENDTGTIRVATETIEKLQKNNIKLVTFADEPVNKPHALNVGLNHATKDIIVVFDAEDEPHPDIYKVANSVFIRDKSDVIQSGVQLMNFNSRWFSMLNVLEYYFWFKSALHFFSRIGLVPLGGNTVFFRSNWLQYVEGWDETCLTEDADIGIRLSLAGAKMRIIYDEAHTTQEETPSTIQDFIRQRARWNQGFLQILFHGSWLKFPKLSQKLLSLYILLWPQIQMIIFIYIPISLILLLSFKIPVWVTIITMFPLYCMFLQLLTHMVGLYQFTRDYKLKYPLSSPARILLSFIPYQLMLGYSAIRATSRYLSHSNNWDKTLHTNEHRKMVPAELYDSKYL